MLSGGREPEIVWLALLYAQEIENDFLVLMWSTHEKSLRVRHRVGKRNIEIFISLVTP